MQNMRTAEKKPDVPHVMETRPDQLTLLFLKGRCPWAHAWTAIRLSTSAINVLYVTTNNETLRGVS
jgi:hypothetical protein